MSAPRDDSVYLQHIRDAIARIESYVEGVTEQEFFETPLLQDGVIRQILIIGEATKDVPALAAKLGQGQAESRTTPSAR